ncbi:MAG: DUF4136 domain-containing protein [Chitinophagaceae bacterium]|nr:DUF4136 domain-containing protein [Chitinophagaceae bacterium]
MKIKSIKPWMAIGIAALLFTSCASVAHIEKDDNADFSKYKTYSWIEKENADKDKRNDLVEKNIRTAVNKELAAEGWRETKSNPDILLSYDVLIERSTRQQNDPVYSRPFTRTFYNPYSRRFFNVYYPSQFVGYDDYNVPIKEGTITITMTDAGTDKMVWQGWTTDEVNNRNITSKEIQTSVKSIFRKFDVAKK